MYYARMAMAVAGGDVEAATVSGDVVTAPKFSAQLMVIEKLGASPSTAIVRPVIGETVEVFNIKESGIESGQRMVIGQTIDETWVVECLY